MLLTLLRLVSENSAEDEEKEGDLYDVTKTKSVAGSDRSCVDTPPSQPPHPFVEEPFEAVPEAENPVDDSWPTTSKKGKKDKKKKKAVLVLKWD